jgi:putative endonuclease
MKHEFDYYVYIMASVTGTLYIGVTNNLRRRIYEHQNEIYEGFSKKYKCHKLVFYEHYSIVSSAIEREKQLKKWNRKKKEWLIKTINPTWADLAYDL